MLVDAVFEKLSAMSAAELRELVAGAAFARRATRGICPACRRIFPSSGYVKNTAKYVVGPVGLEKISAPLPAHLVDFNAGAEVALGKYQTSDGHGHADADRLSDAADGRGTSAPDRRRHTSPTRTQAGSPIASLNMGPSLRQAHRPDRGDRDRRDFAGRSAQSLLSAVNYEADVTWNENTYQGKKNNLGNLLLNVFLLCGILIVFAAVAGLAFGGIRIFFNRILPERVLHREKDDGFHLPEPVRGSGRGRRFQGKPINQSRLGRAKAAQSLKMSRTADAC